MNQGPDRRTRLELKSGPRAIGGRRCPVVNERAIRERERRAAERHSAPTWPTYRLLPVEVPDLSDGHCRGAGDLFFPEGEGRTDQVDAAIRVCQGCPLRTPCLEYAIAAREQHGVWGGVDRDRTEQKQWPRRRKRRKTESTAIPQPTDQE